MLTATPAPPSAVQPKIQCRSEQTPHFAEALAWQRMGETLRNKRSSDRSLFLAPRGALVEPEESLRCRAPGHRQRLSAAFSHHEVPTLFEKCKICIPASSGGIQPRRWHVGGIRTEISWNTSCKQMNFQKGGLGLSESSPA